MDRKRLAFLTLSDPSGFFIYDKLAFEPLAQLGWDVAEVPWDRPNEDWCVYDAVVIRSTWDYQHRVDEFLSVLDTITRAGIPLQNSVDIVRWNLKKTYLQDLQQQGIPIVPTEWSDGLAGDPHGDRFFDHWGVGEIVIKPQVGANADDTLRIQRGSREDWQRARSTFAARECLVQPFVDSIRGLGEYSLFYFDGRYSHCVAKRPAAGDFRVQEEHGGEISAIVAPQPVRAVGAQTVAALPDKTLYARVDLVRTSEDQWSVMEVELIEPSLYFAYNDQSPVRFAAALDQTFRDVIR